MKIQVKRIFSGESKGSVSGTKEITKVFTESNLN